MPAACTARSNDPFYHYWIKHHRARAATELIHYKDMRHTLRFLQGGGNLWYALDQDMGPRVSVFAPFFGVAAASVNILPKLRQRTGAHWIPVYMWREADDHYVVRVAPEIKPVTGESDTDVMRRVNTDYEREIRQHPEQYYWLHRRYKNRPGRQPLPLPGKTAEKALTLSPHEKNPAPPRLDHRLRPRRQRRSLCRTGVRQRRALRRRLPTASNTKT